MFRTRAMISISSNPLRIDPSGFVDVPFAERIQAAGLTSEQFKAELATKLTKYVDTPQIALNVIDNQSRPVSVPATVHHLEVQEIQGPKYLLEGAVDGGRDATGCGAGADSDAENEVGPCSCGGVRLDGGGTFNTATFSLVELMAGTSASVNPASGGDSITVPKAELVYMVGDVKKAGGARL